MKKTKTPSRKREHVELTVKKNVSFRGKSAGFQQYEFEHNALPEINFSEISTETVFLSKKISFPLLLSCMTGGYQEAVRINRLLAEACEEFQLPMGVGSQRQAMENSLYHESFRIARKAAPSIPLLGNIGAPEIAQMKDFSPVLRLAELIHADGFAVHLNPLQEFLQPEGNTNFRGVLSGIEKLVKELSVPVIVKEIGAGISGDTARRLVNIGVQYLDVAGAGGTSWAGVEILRRKDAQEDWNPFWDWGIATVDSLNEVVQLKGEVKKLSVIASGGITNGVECAKAIALGADLTASARPMITALMKNGKSGLKKKISLWRRQLQGAMFLIGASSIEELQYNSHLKKNT
ncbi:MAG: type 2 isopentenyl-diphosphate Delta-isomerase [Bacteroidetes bacterium]|nr:type 2 isopentenyl-diphosphate Delta-isomerase [Bacteroidota bacterium]